MTDDGWRKVHTPHWYLRDSDSGEGRFRYIDPIAFTIETDFARATP